MEKAGMHLEFLDINWQDVLDDSLFYIRAAIAEHEKEIIRERMVRGKTQKAKQRVVSQ